jgi:hypothetical protein
MLRDEKLYLPDSWEAVLEQLILITPITPDNGRVYICSPCRADSAEGLCRNIKAARVYMFYAYQYMSGVPVAPHAYLPCLLNDSAPRERAFALQIGNDILTECKRILVCGSRLSEGMRGEIADAVRYGIPVHVFNTQVYDELYSYMEAADINPKHVRHENDHPHYALAWGSDELAPYWDEHPTVKRKSAIARSRLFSSVTRRS